MQLNTAMDTQQLQAFITIAELNSFSKAAQQLHLTQPAVSKRIANLEDNLGCKLLDRIGRSIRLTEAGSALLPRAKKILNEFNDTRNAISNLSGNVQGSLKLATSHHIGLHHLPNILRRYTEQFPNVDLELEFLDSDKAYEAIQQGKIELAIITLSTQKHQSINTLPLWHDQLNFVCSVNHPLAREKNPSLHDLAKYPAILPDASTTTTQLVQTLMNKANTELKLSMPTNYLETIKMMISIGLGWSALPSTLIDDQLVTLNLKDATLSRTLGCITNQRHSLSNAAQAFIRLIEESTALDK